MEEYRAKLDEQWKETEVHITPTGVTTALHQAAAEDTVHIVGFLLDSLKSGEYSTALRMMMLATDDEGRTALHLAAMTNSAQALKKYGNGLKQ